MGRHPGAGAALTPRSRRGFTLLEVLVTLGLASLVLGALLSAAGTETLRIAQVEPRYRALVTASAVLEKAADRGFKGSESGRTHGLAWKLKVGTVPADPRVDQLQVDVTGTRVGTSVTLWAYRLRAKHKDPGAAEKSPSPSPSPSAGPP